ncbi:MAG: dihydroorotate dehydrogenase electron transfer subunit [Phycisphaerales bacterium]|nr:dihydroorotate dehydrogenase electron transfer subunit [Phycisphaerales bacterium]
MSTATAAPPKQSTRGHYVGLIGANTPICQEHYRLTLQVLDFPASEPGQFVQLFCAPSLDPDAAVSGERYNPTQTSRQAEFEWPIVGRPLKFHDEYLLANRPYLRRPFSIAERRDLPASDTAPATTEIDIIHRVIGKGTRELESLEPGESISLLGPLGRGFALPQTLTHAVLVGGGVGIPPMIYLAEKLARQNIPSVAFVGAQRRNLLPLALQTNSQPSPAGKPGLCCTEFARHNIATAITTDDGSLGMRGFVTAALDQYLGAATAAICAGTVVFCCGPTPMMKAAADVAQRHHVPCMVSLEQPMACGMGTCQSCVIKYKPAGAADWVYKLTCTDGPVFNAADILW